MDAKSNPTGWVSVCQCGANTGAIDRTRTESREVSKIISKWLQDGKTIKPMFGSRWSAMLESCKCAAAPEQPATAEVKR